MPGPFRREGFMTGAFGLMAEINWQLIIFTLLLSALVALLGDVLGMKIAKKRVTLLGLRPRHTSSLITAITGMIIALGIMAALSVLSDTVRTALFSMKYVRRQVLELTANLQESREESDLMELQYVDTLQKLEEKEGELDALLPELDRTKDEIRDLKKQRDDLDSQVESLKNEASRLRKGLEEVREGRVVAFADELLAQEAVPEAATEDDLREILTHIRDRVRFAVAMRASLEPQEVSIIRDEDDEARVLARCRMIESRKVIRARAMANVVAREPVRLEYRVYESVLVYRKNEVILSRIIRPGMDREEIEQTLHSVLREVNGLAVKDGILADPLTRTVGRIDATDFFNAVESLNGAKTPRILEIVAEGDIYTEGPVRVLLRADQKEE